MDLVSLGSTHHFGGAVLVYTRPKGVPAILCASSVATEVTELCSNPTFCLLPSAFPNGASSCRLRLPTPASNLLLPPAFSLYGESQPPTGATIPSQGAAAARRPQRPSSGPTPLRPA